VFCPELSLSSPTLSTHAAVQNAVDEFRPDVVHGNAAVGLSLIAHCWQRGIPYIQHVRVPACGHLEEELAAASRVVAVSNYAGRAAIRAGAPPLNVDVVYDGVDTTRFAPQHLTMESARRIVGMPSASPVVGMIARFTASKRHDLLLEAVQLARSAGMPLQALFVGDISETGSNFAEVKNVAATRGLEASVHWRGFQPDICPAIAACDVIALCSDFEPLGQSILEAIAMGKPVVVTTSGGLPELLRGQPFARLTAPDDAEALKGAIEDLLSADRHRLGAEARAFALDTLTIDHSARALADVWRVAAECPLSA
jgi:glycosyltransferase involved in cell wall biosynthesis